MQNTDIVIYQTDKNKDKDVSELISVKKKRWRYHNEKRAFKELINKLFKIRHKDTRYYDYIFSTINDKNTTIERRKGEGIYSIDIAESSICFTVSFMYEDMIYGIKVSKRRV